MTPTTPGPWHARPRNINNDLTQDAIAGLGWDVLGPPEPMLRGQFAKAADAYLVAAAPDILAALEGLLIHDVEWAKQRTGREICWECSNWREEGHTKDCPFGNARAAIAKAKGE